MWDGASQHVKSRCYNRAAASVRLRRRGWKAAGDNRSREVGWGQACAADFKRILRNADYMRCRIRCERLGWR